MCKRKVEIEHSETRCENGSKVKRQKPYRRSEATQIPLQVCFVNLQPSKRISSAHKGHRFFFVRARCLSAGLGT